MRDSTNSGLLASLLRALKPIARFLMKAGIGYREFSEIAKCAFVDVSSNDYGLRGRPTNISRVAVMTGLTRKEVRRLRDKIESGNTTDVTRVVPPAEILEKWHSDPQFLDREGRPLPLVFDGSQPSFAQLVRNYGGDIPPGAMRTELKRVGAIEERDDGLLQVQKRYFRPVELDEQLQRALGQAIYGLSLALDHNLGNETDKAWVERLAFSTKIHKTDAPRVRQVAQDRAADLVKSIDDLFAAYETIYNDDESSEATSVVGVGVYYFEEDAAASSFSAPDQKTDRNKG